jgi:hypothetical protein
MMAAPADRWRRSVAVTDERTFGGQTLVAPLRRPPPPRAATRCGSTSARSWWTAATGRTTRASERCAKRCRGSRCSRSTCRVCGARRVPPPALADLPLDDDLVVAYPSLMPIRLLELLAERGIAIVGVPEEEFGSLGPNVLALASRVGGGARGNSETRRRMEWPAWTAGCSRGRRSRTRPRAVRPASPARFSAVDRRRRRVAQPSSGLGSRYRLARAVLTLK